jgi:hypothetical protein
LWAIHKLSCPADLLCKSEYLSGLNHTDDLHWLLHAAKPDKQAVVQDYIQIADKKPFPIRAGLRFVKITCSSYDDALKRSLSLSMLTLIPKTKAFVKLFTIEQLQQGFTLTNITRQFV